MASLITKQRIQNWYQRRKNVITSSASEVESHISQEETEKRKGHDSKPSVTAETVGVVNEECDYITFQVKKKRNQ